MTEVSECEIFCLQSSTLNARRQVVKAEDAERLAREAEARNQSDLDTITRQVRNQAPRSQVPSSTVWWHVSDTKVLRKRATRQNLVCVEDAHYLPLALPTSTSYLPRAG